VTVSSLTLPDRQISTTASAAGDFTPEDRFNASGWCYYTDLYGG
jgi:hypothetical protein